MISLQDAIALLMCKKDLLEKRTPVFMKITVGSVVYTRPVSNIIVSVSTEESFRDPVVYICDEATADSIENKEGYV